MYWLSVHIPCWCLLNELRCVAPSSLGELLEYPTLPYFISVPFLMGGKLEISALKTQSASCAIPMTFPVVYQPLKLTAFLCVSSLSCGNTSTLGWDHFHTLNENL